MGSATVLVERCWGCNRIRLPKPWTPEWLPLLNRERRLRWGEYLCSRGDCMATTIANRGR